MTLMMTIAPHTRTEIERWREEHAFLYPGGGLVFLVRWGVVLPACFTKFSTES
jgi:hypothetical protein